MGQQQILLIVLAVIVVGVAIIVGINLFQANSIEQKRDLLINEGMTIATNAIQYFHKPKVYGGGQFSFTDWQIPPHMVESGNGIFSFEVVNDQVEITGTGNDLVSGSELVEVKFYVSRNGIETEIIN